MRNPDDTLWPASDEWWKLYALVNNKSCGGVASAWYWPVAAPGTAQGGNIANPLMTFVFGRDYNGNGDIEPEVNRITNGNGPPSTIPKIEVAILSDNPNTDAAETWAKAKLQRGWIETTPPYRATANAYEAAHSAYDWRYTSWAPYLKSYACFHPVPRDEGSCPEYNLIFPPKWTAKFTPLIPGYPPLEFGTCPGVSGHIQYLDKKSDRYVLYFQDKPAMTLPYNIYLEGPYDGGGSLNKAHSELLTQALNKFIVDMRGNTIERADTCNYNVEGKAFDFQRFLSSQYALAPAAGGVYDENTGEVKAGDYPTFRLDYSNNENNAQEQTIASGTVFTMMTAGTEVEIADNKHFINNPFVLSAVYVVSSNVISDCYIELLDSVGQPIRILAPNRPCENETEFADSIKVIASRNTTTYHVTFLSPAVNPGSVRVRLNSEAKLAKDGYIQVELLEQIAYIPDIQDAYAVLRCGLTKGAKADEEPDNVGNTLEGEKVTAFSNNYFKYGCIYNVEKETELPQSATAINYNAIYESARQMINDNLRMLPRDQVYRYAVEGGKSVLYFDRLARKNDTPGSIQTVETEIQPVIKSAVANIVTASELKDRIEYVVRKLDWDNVKPVISTNINNYSLVAKYPVSCYSENEVYVCDDYVLYGNVKYTPPGYYLAATTELSPMPVSDRDKNFDHVIVGKGTEYQPLAVGTDVEVFFNNSFVRHRMYVDSLDVPREEIINTARFYWRSVTRYGTTTSNTEFKNMSLHDTGLIEQGSLNQFKYNNGYRYAIERRFKTNGIWSDLDWTYVATAPSGNVNSSLTYGFDPTGDSTAGTGAGVFFVEDRLAYGISADDVEYRITAKAVVDTNHSKMVVYQRAYFTPRSITWSDPDKSKKFRVERIERKFGDAADSAVDVSGIIDDGLESHTFIDSPTSICPVAIAIGATNYGTYTLHDTIVGYNIYTVGSSASPIYKSIASLSPLECVICPDNIQTTKASELFGKGDAELLDVNGVSIEGGQQFCTGVQYKLYGATAGSSQAAITFNAPVTDNTTVTGVQKIRVLANGKFGWYYSNGTSNAPFTPSINNFTDLTRVWYDGVDESPAYGYQEAQIYQYGRYYSGCSDVGIIENTAGCEPGNFTGVFAFDSAIFKNINPAINLSAFRGVVTTNEPWFKGTPTSFAAGTRGNTPVKPNGDGEDDDELYQSTLRLTQWTPWTPLTSFNESGGILDSNLINTSTCPWYVLRTGYERVYIRAHFFPGPGTYTVRGLGYLIAEKHNKGTLDNEADLPSTATVGDYYLINSTPYVWNGTNWDHEIKKYYSGNTITIAADDALGYTVSDSSVKIVTSTTYGCSSNSFDFLAGIAPTGSLGEADLRIGVKYVVYKGEGITYLNANDAVVTVLPKSTDREGTFTWEAGCHGLVITEKKSEIRPVDGIVQLAKPHGLSNEWCMFISFNHYHTSESSIWKPTNYGDIMPFLHNRCHTWATEISAPWHTSLAKYFSYGISPPVVSEAPPGYTYLEDINLPVGESDQIKNYYKSCQIYKPPYEIESATIEYTEKTGLTDEDGNQAYDDNVVKITFKDRIQHTKEAALLDEALLNTPEKIVTSGNVDDATLFNKLRTEPYRTDENGIREYLVYTASGKNCVRNMTGDSSNSFNIFTLTDEPFGCCHPRFYFVKLIPSVYVDEDEEGKKADNDTVEPDSDTLIYMDPYLQMDLYLRAMCGGWMDIESQRAINCHQGLSESMVADYLYENLCYQACRSYGTHIHVTPEVLQGRHFLPEQIITNYSFNYDTLAVPLIAEYRTWELDHCAFSNWNILQGEIQPGQVDAPLGGSNYTNPTVTISENSAPGIDFHETEATATVKNGVITAIQVTDPDNHGYIYAPTVTITDNMGTGAYAIAEIELADAATRSYKVARITLIPKPSTGLAEIEITQNGATMVPTQFRFSPASAWENGVRVRKTEAYADAAVGVTEEVNVNFYFIRDSSANPHMYEIKRNDYEYGNGCQLAKGDWTVITPKPNGEAGPACDANLNHATYDDCTLHCSCRWTDTNRAGITDKVTSGASPKPIDGAVPAPGDLVGSTYRIEDLTYNPTVTRSTGAITVGMIEPGSGYTAPVVFILGGGGTYSSATATVAAGEITGITVIDSKKYTSAPTVLIMDETGTGAIAEAVTDNYFESYYLAWPMQPRVVYDVERQLNYKFNPEATWETLASDVRSPYIDNAPYETSFSEDVTDSVTKNYSDIGGEAPFSTRTFSVNITAENTYKNLYVDCVMTVSVPDELGGGMVDTFIVLDTLRIPGPETAQLFEITDSRTFILRSGSVITAYAYTVKILESVTINWRLVENHVAMTKTTEDKFLSALSYKVHRKFKTSSLGSEEVIAKSTTADPAPLNWEGWGDEPTEHTRLDDIRNNDDEDTGVNTETFYVEATWKDWPVVLSPCEEDWQQNREDPCLTPTGTGPCLDLDRRYRVVTKVNARSRWFTAMPIAINMDRPQGFSPVPNTCTYAEMFNNFARATNLLTYARLELPFTKRKRAITYTSVVPDSLTEPPLHKFGDEADTGYKLGVCPAATPYATYSNWDVVLVGDTAVVSATVGTSGWNDAEGSTCSGEETTLSVVQFAVNSTQDCFAAIPEQLMSNFDLSNLLLVGTDSYNTQTGSIKAHLSNECAQSWCGGPGQLTTTDLCVDYADDDPVLRTWGTSARRLFGNNCGRDDDPDDNYRARHEYIETSRGAGNCVYFLAGIVTPPPLTCGDTSWLSHLPATEEVCAGYASYSERTVDGIRSLVYLTFPLV